VALSPSKLRTRGELVAVDAGTETLTPPGDPQIPVWPTRALPVIRASSPKQSRPRCQAYQATSQLTRASWLRRTPLRREQHRTGVMVGRSVASLLP